MRKMNAFFMIIIVFVFSGCSRSNFTSSTVSNDNSQNSIKKNLTGYWLHDSGMYGFESYYFSSDGKGWCYGMIKNEDETYIYGYSEIKNWQITKECKLKIKFGEINCKDYTINSGENIRSPINFTDHNTLQFEPNDASEPLYLLRVQEVAISGDLKTATVKYLNGVDYYGHTPATITIVDIN